jgi:hypothetical protein
VSRKVGSSLMSIQGRLDDLTAARFLSASDAESRRTYQYRPENEQIRALIDGVAEAYKVRRLAVIDIIYGKPASNIRSFSDAFKLGRKKEGS